jgi:hypothetical protein
MYFWLFVNIDPDEKRHCLQQSYHLLKAETVAAFARVQPPPFHSYLEASWVRVLPGRCFFSLEGMKKSAGTRSGL